MASFVREFTEFGPPVKFCSIAMPVIIIPMQNNQIITEEKLRYISRDHHCAQTTSPADPNVGAHFQFWQTN